MKNNMIPSISNEGNLASYMEQIKKFPLLEAKEEYILSGKEFGDVLNHHLKINNAFDRIIEIFSEPGIDKNFILNLKCTSLPSLEWSIPSIDTDAIPTS